jgi:hypothetical protein
VSIRDKLLNWALRLRHLADSAEAAPSPHGLGSELRDLALAIEQETETTPEPSGEGGNAG